MDKSYFKKIIAKSSDDIKYISAGKLNEEILGKVKVLKKTNTLVFISCEIFGSDKIIASASGTWKIL